MFWKGPDGHLWQAINQIGGGGAPAKEWSNILSVPNITMGASAEGPTATAWTDQTNTTQVDIFWKGTSADGYDLMEAYYENGVMFGPFHRNMGPLGSAPTAGSDANGNQYVFWQGSGNNHLWEAFYDAQTRKWSRYDLGDGTHGNVTNVYSPPGVAVYADPQDGGQVQDVYYVGLDAGLWHAFHKDGRWHDPREVTVTSTGHGMGPLPFDAAPAAMGFGEKVEVYWKGKDQTLWEAFYDARTSQWDQFHFTGLNDMGQLGSAPTVCHH
jgi:hypothetical protein